MNPPAPEEPLAGERKSQLISSLPQTLPSPSPSPPTRGFPPEPFPAGSPSGIWEQQDPAAAPREEITPQTSGDPAGNEGLGLWEGSRSRAAAPAAASCIPAGSEMQRWILHPSLWLLESLHKPQCALNPTTKSSQRAINILIPVAG